MARRTGRADQALARVMLEEYPEDAVPLIESSEDAESAALLEREGAEASMGLIRRLTPDRAARILACLPPEVMRRAVAGLNPNRAAALFARLDADEKERCLAFLDESVASELRDLSSYSAETAGALMDPRATSFRPDSTVRDVTRRLRRFRSQRVQDIFVVDEEGKLVGSIPLEEIVLADPPTRLDGLVREAPVSVQSVSSRDEIVQTFGSHRVASLPVVDFDGRLLGVLRQRDIVQAARLEATASAVTMVGASEQERALSPPLFAVRKRLPWLQINLLTAFLAASVVGLFEETIAKVTALAILLPVVAGQSGNTGAQALAVTMRGLALREVRTRHWLRVVTKEAIAGAGNGVAVAATTSAAVYLWSQSVGLALVIGSSMVLSMTLAGLSGAAIPMILTALRQDPAQSSSIVLTTVTDVVGFFSFLGIATLLSGML
jgi:magnesium transporter